MSVKRGKQTKSGSNTPGWLLAVQLFCLVALAVSGYLAWLSFTAGSPIGCGPNSGCEQVLRSRWAYWFGVPVSLFALAIYLVILGGTQRLKRELPAAVRRQTWRWVLACAWLVTGAALWFIALQILAVSALCAYCLVAHGSGLTAALLLTRTFRQDAPAPARTDGRVISGRVLRNTAFIGSAGLAILVFGQLVHAPKEHLLMALATNTTYSTATTHVTNTTAATNAATTATNATNAVSAAIPAGRKIPVYGGRLVVDLADVPLMGEPTNEHVVVSLFDYTCPSCRRLHPILRQVEQGFSNRLVVASMPMPLEPICNELVLRPSPTHSNACAYARLGLAVWRAEPGKHAEFDDWLMTGTKPPALAAAEEHAARLVGSNALAKANADPWIDQQLKLSMAIYRVAYDAGKGEMPQTLIGSRTAVGIFSADELKRWLAEFLGLKAEL